MKDLTKVYKKYKGQWVALDDNLLKVITSSYSAKKTYQEAIKKGYKEPTLFKVPAKNIPYFGIYL